MPEEYGGDTIMCNVSAQGRRTGQPARQHQLLAEMASGAVADRHAEGRCSRHASKGRGPVPHSRTEWLAEPRRHRRAGTVWGRVRAMNDFNGDRIKSAGPSSPIEIVVQDVERGRPTSSSSRMTRPEHSSSIASRPSVEASGPESVKRELLAQASEGERVQLNLTSRPMNSTLEATRGRSTRSTSRCDRKFLHAAVGGVTESDVTLAQTYGAVIIGFNVRPDQGRHLADEPPIQLYYAHHLRSHRGRRGGDEGSAGSQDRGDRQGHSRDRDLPGPQSGTVAGGFKGSIARSHQVRLLRDGVILWTGKLASLRRFKDDVREVEKGYECGMNLEGFNDIKVGDMLETFVQEEVSPV